jgi:hypothetical protein
LIKLHSKKYNVKHNNQNYYLSYYNVLEWIKNKITPDVFNLQFDINISGRFELSFNIRKKEDLITVFDYFKNIKISAGYSIRESINVSLGFYLKNKPQLFEQFISEMQKEVEEIKIIESTTIQEPEEDNEKVYEKLKLYKLEYKELEGKIPVPTYLYTLYEIKTEDIKKTIQNEINDEIIEMKFSPYPPYMNSLLKMKLKTKNKESLLNIVGCLGVESFIENENDELEFEMKFKFPHSFIGICDEKKVKITQNVKNEDHNWFVLE